MDKIVIYQILTRLFANTTGVNVPNGTLAQNGCAKFSYFTPRMLAEIKKLGTTHVWYTGILEHATQTDYTRYGIDNDHAGIVKGKAGSPYAVRDYYDVDPDLADNPANRMQEFEKLVARTHKAGLKMIIDFVPNHVARQYHSDVKPETDFGRHDRTDWHFSPQNNFYYYPHTPLAPQFDVQGYCECPAKATGNDCFSPAPSRNDWYETAKLNYGVDYTGDHAGHFDPLPDTWTKMRDILLFWAAKNVDGFRCDMAEMVPVEFWQWVIGEVKRQFPQVVFVAEVYNPAQYRSYIHTGGFDYLYDKVGLYDTLRSVTCYGTSAHQITQAWQQVFDIQGNMLNFLENHDEQRIASDFFAGQADKGRPAMLVAACMNTNPVMIYFGQEVGERGMEAEGFSGRDGRTTIFDYWSVDSINRLYNKQLDKSRLSDDEQNLLQFYRTLLTLCHTERALSNGRFFDLMYANGHLQRQYAFVRADGHEVLLCLANFSDEQACVSVFVPRHAFDYLQLSGGGACVARDLLVNTQETIRFAPDESVVTTVAPWNCKILKISL
ncbi:MAG: alpha-amylase family glycosyl hydrolase [Bacteroidales bacterium]|nr:alpha-amylase family glycosyl hydrolase [Bacteroidales bacterium]